MKTMTATHVRWMKNRDMPSVIAIEKESFDEPWSKEEFLIALRQGGAAGLVAERNGEVVGYLVYEMHMDEIQILNLAVRGRSQMLGVGKHLLQRLKERLNAQRQILVCDVRESNLNGQLFFRQVGFLCKKVFYGWFASDKDSTAYRFEYRGGDDCGR